MVFEIDLVSLMVSKISSVVILSSFSINARSIVSFITASRSAPLNPFVALINLIVSIS